MAGTLECRECKIRRNLLKDSERTSFLRFQNSVGELGTCVRQQVFFPDWQDAEYLCHFRVFVFCVHERAQLGDGESFAPGSSG